MASVFSTGNGSVAGKGYLFLDEARLVMAGNTTWFSVLVSGDPQYGSDRYLRLIDQQAVLTSPHPQADRDDTWTGAEALRLELRGSVSDRKWHLNANVSDTATTVTMDNQPVALLVRVDAGASSDAVTVWLAKSGLFAAEPGSGSALLAFTAPSFHIGAIQGTGAVSGGMSIDEIRAARTFDGIVDSSVPVPVAPSITAQSGSATVAAGQSITLTLTAAGSAPLAYVWKRGTATVGGNSPSLLIAAA